MYQSIYKRFLKENKDIQHFACHSHYYWPDVTRDAMLEYWDDSARYVDAKWDYFFTEKVPLVQKYIMGVLHTSTPEQIVFAPNTHEFILRLLSCFAPGTPLNILTTDSEFHSFRRQSDRLSEFENVQLTKVPVLPFNTFEERFIAEICQQKWDLIFFSHIFFNCGIPVRSLENIVRAVNNQETMIVVDGYHAFMALPIDLHEIENRIFYIAGSYKYAQGGEGCCFIHVPINSQLRPWNSGWFADFSSLEKPSDGTTNYSNNGYRFGGSTMDFSALYRLLSVFQLFENIGLTNEKIHQFIQNRQASFLSEIEKYDHPLINKKRLLVDDLNHHGHFFTFQLDSAEQVEKMCSLLREYNIITDFRGDRLRFGFALYHPEQYDLSVLNTRRAYFFDEFLFS